MSQGRYELWAAVASVLFHGVVLSVLAAARLYPESYQSTSSQSDQACLATVRSMVQNRPVVARPNVRHTSGADYIRWPLDLQGESVTLTSDAQAVNGKPEFPTPSSYADLGWSQERPSPQEIKFFSSGTRSRRICYLVDCSGSMKGLLAQVKDELARSITALRSDQYFGIVFFGNDRVRQFVAGRLVRASQDAKTRALAFVESVNAAGRTNALAGFDSAVRMRDDDGARPEVILFLTDGFELSTTDAYQFRQDVLELRSRYLSGCAVNTIGFWPSESDRQLLQSIAHLSGGTFVSIAEKDL